MKSQTTMLIDFLLDFLNLVKCEFCEEGCEHCDNKGFKKIPSGFQ